MSDIGNLSPTEAERIETSSYLIADFPVAIKAIAEQTLIPLSQVAQYVV